MKIIAVGMNYVAHYELHADENYRKNRLFL